MDIIKNFFNSYSKTIDKENNADVTAFKEYKNLKISCFKYSGPNWILMNESERARFVKFFK